VAGDLPARGRSSLRPVELEVPRRTGEAAVRRIQRRRVEGEEREGRTSQSLRSTRLMTPSSRSRTLQIGRRRWSWTTLMVV
jgi:hypothetical protein